MERDKFNDIKSLEKRIENLELKIQHIDKLSKCCGLNAKISGTPPNTFLKTDDYVLMNNEFIKKLLVSERANLFSELEELYKQFAEM